MSDNKTKQDGRDDSRIDANDPNELAYEARKLGVEVTDIREAIAAVGNLRVDVEKYLKNK